MALKQGLNKSYGALYYFYSIVVDPIIKGKNKIRKRLTLEKHQRGSLVHDLVSLLSFIYLSFITDWQ